MSTLDQIPTEIIWHCVVKKTKQKQRDCMSLRNKPIKWLVRTGMVKQVGQIVRNETGRGQRETRFFTQRELRF